MSERLFKLRQMLNHITSNGQVGLFSGLQNQGILKDGELLEEGIKSLKARAERLGATS